MQQQVPQLQPNMPQQQHLVAGGQNVNQTSPLLAQQLAGRPPVPGQPLTNVMPGQPGAGPMMQPRPPLIQTQQLQVRQQFQPGQQAITQGTSGAVTAANTTSTPGDGPSVSSEDLEGLDSNVPNELGDLGMGDGDFLDMGDDFNILEFTDALDDLEEMQTDENKSSTIGKASTTTSISSSASSTTSSSPATSIVSSNSSNSIVSNTSSISVGATTTSVSLSGSTIRGNSNIVTSSAGPTGAMPTTHLATQPPPYAASGSVTVPLRGALPQATLAGAIPGASTSIVRGPPPPYPGPGLAPSTGAGGPTSIQTTTKVNAF